MNRILSFFIFTLLCFSASAQISEKLAFEMEYQLKFSIGQASTQSFDVFNKLTVDLPYVARYGYPVNALNANVLYKLGNHFSAGLGFGFNFVKFESIPFDPNSYYDKLSIPIYGRFKYNHDFKNKWLALVELDAGYQYTDSRWSYISALGEYGTTEKGGVMAGVNFGFGKQLKKCKPMVKIGYEFNQFSRQYIYSNKQNFLPTTYQTINIKTYYNLLKVGVSLIF